MEIKTLRTATLEDALAEMKVGETAYAPEGYTELNNSVFSFTSHIQL